MQGDDEKKKNGKVTSRDIIANFIASNYRKFVSEVF